MHSNPFRHYFAIGFFFLLAISAPALLAQEAPSSKAAYSVVFQVSDSDASKWNLTLVNAMNVMAELGKDNVSMEIVVYGPAIDMLRIESEVAPRVDEVISSGVRVVACENTMQAIHITEADMLPDIHYTRSGVAYLIKKQKEGYAYIRP